MAAPDIGQAREKRKPRAKSEAPAIIETILAAWPILIFLDAVCVLAGASFVIAGLLSIGDGETLSDKVEGVTFALGGAAIGATALARFTHGSSPSLAITITGPATGLLLAIYLGITQVSLGNRLWLCAVWVALSVCFSLLLIKALKGLALLQARARRSSSLIAVLSSLGVTASLALSVFQFWYAQAAATASTRSYTLTLQAQLNDAGFSAADADIHLLSANLSLKNPGSAEVLVPRSVYSLLGYQSTRARSDSIVSNMPSFDPGSDTLSRNVDYSNADLLQFGPAFLDASLLEPAQELDRRFEIALPQDVFLKYSVLVIDVAIVVANGSHLQINSGPTTIRSTSCENANSCLLTSRWLIRSPSAIWRFTQGNQVLLVQENVPVRGAASPVMLTGCITDTAAIVSVPCISERTAFGVADFYGTGVAEVGYELPIVAMSNSPAR